MGKAYRKGVVLTFGMISTICNVESAIEKEASLTTVCCGPEGSPHAPTQIKQAIKCATCGEVGYGEVKKAKQEGESFVVIEQDEVAGVKNSTVAATKKLINVTPHDAAEVSSQTLPGDSVYFLVPSDSAQSPAYSMLLDTLDRHPEVAMLCQWTPSSRTNVYQITVHEDASGNKALVMEQRARTENIKECVVDTTDIGADIQGQIDSILPAMVKPFDPATYADQYGKALDSLIASREAVEGVVNEKTKAGPRTTPAAGGVDLMGQLAAMAAGLGA